MAQRQQVQSRLRDADVRLDADDDGVERLCWELGLQLRGDHGEEGFVEVGADIGVCGWVDVRAEFGDGCAEAGAVLGGDVDGDVEGFGSPEELGGCGDSVVIR